MNVLTAIRERMPSKAGHVARMDHSEICAKALRCRGLQWLRWRQLHWKEVEKDQLAGPHPKQCENIFQMGGHGFVKGFQICWKLQMVLRKQSICPQDGCNSLRIVGAGDSVQNMR